MQKTEVIVTACAWEGIWGERETRHRYNLILTFPFNLSYKVKIPFFSEPNI